MVWRVGDDDFIMLGRTSGRTREWERGSVKRSKKRREERRGRGEERGGGEWLSPSHFRARKSSGRP